MRYVYLLIFFVLFIGCNAKKQSLPPNIIPPRQMELILWDYIKADAFCAEFLKRSPGVNDTIENIKLQQTIFDHYKITKEQFYNSYHYYCTQPSLLTAIMDSIIAHEQPTMPYNIPINKLPIDEKSL